MAGTALSAMEMFYFGLTCLDCHEEPSRVSRLNRYCYKCGKEKSFYLCKCGAGLGHDDRGKVNPYCSGCGTKTSKLELTPKPFEESLTKIVAREMTLDDKLKRDLTRLRKKLTTEPLQSTAKSSSQNSARTAGESAESSQELFPMEDDNNVTAVPQTPRKAVSTAVPPSSSKDLLCPICQISLRRPYLLKEHVEIRHNVKTYECSLCDETQVTSHRLKTHYKKIHPEADVPDEKSLEIIVMEAKQWLKNKQITSSPMTNGGDESKIEKDKVESSSSESSDSSSSSSSSSEDESDTASVIYDTSKLDSQPQPTSLPRKSPESPRQASINSEITSVDLQTSELTQKPPNKKVATARRSAGKPLNKSPTAEKLDVTKIPTTKNSDQKKSTAKKIETEPAETPKSESLIEKKRSAEPEERDGSPHLTKSRKQKKSDSDEIQTSPRKQAKKGKSTARNIKRDKPEKISIKPADKIDAGGDRDDEVMEIEVFECVLCGLEFPSTSKLKRHYKKLHGSLDENRMDF